MLSSLYSPCAYACYSLGSALRLMWMVSWHYLYCYVIISLFILFLCMLQPRFGIAFDVDGVLARGTIPIPTAKDAMRQLSDDKGEMQVPVAYVTNALNRNQDKANQIAGWFGTQVSPKCSTIVYPYKFHVFLVILCINFVVKMIDYVLVQPLTTVS